MTRDSTYGSLDSNGQTGNRLANPPPEEPDALIAHVRVCEGSGRKRPGLLGELLQQEGHKVVFRALIWVQGESDAANKQMADGYGDRLKLLLDDFRKNVTKDMILPVILGVDEQHPWVKEFPNVVESQQKLAAEGQNIFFTSMIGLEKADSTHLTPKGLEEHGRRLFASYKT